MIEQSPLFMAFLHEKKAQKTTKRELDNRQKLFIAVFSVDDGDAGEEEDMSEGFHHSQSISNPIRAEISHSFKQQHSNHSLRN
jgi:hypothetical protein